MPDLADALSSADVRTVNIGASSGHAGYVVEFRQSHYEPASTRSSERPLDRLIRLQHADGSWDLTQELLTIVNAVAPSSGLLSRLLSRIARGPEQEQALATALAVLWLQRTCPGYEAEWRLLADKARGWLGRARPPKSGSWFEAAEDVLTP